MEESGLNSHDILSHRACDSQVGDLIWLGSYEHLQTEFMNYKREAKASAKTSYTIYLL